jgi:hypothetical protein
VEIVDAAGRYADPGETGAGYVEHLRRSDLSLGTYCLRAGAAAESSYAGIVRLVSEAEKSQAPFVRLADRYAMWFLPLTVAVAGMRELTPIRLIPGTIALP